MKTEFPIIERFRTLSTIEKYSQLVKLRDLLKDVQQLSWNINNVEKKYPLDSLLESDYESLLKVYIEFEGEIEGIARFFREEIY